jgi:murein DD-endopeptidase MepM/ murein hydrolase activator NlpD
MKTPRQIPPVRTLILAIAVLLSACQPVAALPPGGGPHAAEAGDHDLQAAAMQEALTPMAAPAFTFPSRPRYQPGEFVDYTAQTGDTLTNIASRFNTSVEEILEANTFVPASATTMPPGMPMKIPIYYRPLWGSPFQILPDSLFVNGPAQIGFDTQAFVNSHPGWLKDYDTYAADTHLTGADVVDYAAHYYSVSPRLLLALLEYHAGALSSPTLDPQIEDYPLGKRYWKYKGVFMQVIWTANLLNDGYYGFRTQRLTEIEHNDGRIERFDPWLNAATVSLHNYFNTLFVYEDYARAISHDGFIQTYRDLFGDPWENVQPHIPGSLVQPEFLLPFEPGDVWALTGGPHPAWGTGQPLAALDFAPPSKSSGCVTSDVWATAVAKGLVVRSTTGEVMLDLDADGDERTGWNVFYMHVRTEGRVPLGTILEQGDPVGHPSCEGGSSTGTHIHIARKYNGEWMPADGIGGGVLAFNLEGWVAHNGSRVYLGTMTRNSQVVTACTCSNAASFIQSDRPADETE